jgi:hypothetical protein
MTGTVLILIAAAAGFAGGVYVMLLPCRAYRPPVGGRVRAEVLPPVTVTAEVTDAQRPALPR